MKYSVPFDALAFALLPLIWVLLLPVLSMMQTNEDRPGPGDGVNGRVWACVEESVLA